LPACAADPQVTLHDAAELYAAYFPAICAISALLDSLAEPCEKQVDALGDD
jgi:hypothetical protein